MDKTEFCFLICATFPAKQFFSLLGRLCIKLWNKSDVTLLNWKKLCKYCCIGEEMHRLNGFRVDESWCCKNTNNLNSGNENFHILIDKNICLMQVTCTFLVVYLLMLFLSLTVNFQFTQKCRHRLKNCILV